MIRVTDDGGGLMVYTPYNPGMVADLKSSVPASERKFDPARKAWVVGYTYAPVVSALLLKHFKQQVQMPLPQHTVTFERVLAVKYIGQCKDRGSERIAFGWMDDSWSVVFPEAVLREWFEGIKPQGAPSINANTLYSVLGARQTATAAEIKTAFRRMALQWHPDVCKEPDAQQRFMQIQAAYEVLSIERKRARYDAGLALSATVEKQPQDAISWATAYRPPLRCGLILAEVRESVGRLMVEKIKLWEDIVSGNLTLVTSWPMGATKPQEEWI